MFKLRAESAPNNWRSVKNLYDQLVDGNEYGSLVAVTPQEDPVESLQRGLRDLEQAAGHPVLVYAANMVKAGLPETSISYGDDLPFREMVELLPKSDCVAVVVATPGGLGEQVDRFVQTLRARFERVEFIIPWRAMSAGTLFALSGDAIWMDDRSCLGPIDPQVQTATGQYAPAQGILRFIEYLRQQIEEKRIDPKADLYPELFMLKNVDQLLAAKALTASEYSVDMATRFLCQYKFRHWARHSSTNALVTDQEREQRARSIAKRLCDHMEWKTHGHAFGRDELSDLGLQIQKLESNPPLHRAVRRLWAMMYFIFDRTNVIKGMFSANYKSFRQQVVATEQMKK